LSYSIVAGTVWLNFFLLFYNNSSKAFNPN
jgi:hypothetical protein